MALRIELSRGAASYLSRLDKPTKQRMADKLKEISNDPHNIRFSKPLTNSNKRSAQVGGYRLLLLIEEDVLIVSEIGPRGQIYRDL